MNNEKHYKMNLNNIDVAIHCNKKNGGITLIVLIITIVILLILVAVSIRIVVNGGLFDHTKDAVAGWTQKQEKEHSVVNNMVKKWDEYLGETEENIPDIKISFSTEAYCSDKNIDYINIDVTGISEEGKELNYTLYWGTGLENLQHDQVINGISSGEKVVFEKKGLDDGTKYFWRVDASDGIGKLVGEVNNTYTYCKTELCNGSKITCTTCQGSLYTDGNCSTCEGKKVVGKCRRISKKNYFTSTF